MALRAALDARLTDCGLTLHPDKTKIVYCRDESRRHAHPTFKFDFLGYEFRPRLVSKKTGGMGVSFSPAASPTALKAIRGTVRSWSLHLRSDKALDDVDRGMGGGELLEGTLLLRKRCIARSRRRSG